MNSSTSRYERAIDEQAAIWAARLDGDVLEGNQRAELDAWLAKSPAHRAALSQYCQLSADLEERLPKLVAAGGVAMPTPKRKARILTFPRIASLALAAAAAVVLGVWVAQPAPQVENFACGLVERKTEILSDGTRVELNAHTSLRFENTKTERRVQLVGGEAFFEVTKDKSRPFTVYTPAGKVRVTGTKFNVRTDSSASAFEVTVIEGSVKVTPSIGTSPSKTFPLVGGEQLSARRGREPETKTLSATALDDELAWREGWIVFNATPLPEAAARFAHHHGKSITVDPALANELLGARYRLDDFYGFVKAIDEQPFATATIDANGAATIVPKR
jgi:transmembrane sensor